MGSIFGETPDPIAAPDYSQMQPQINALSAQANNNQPWNAETKTPGQAQFDFMAQQGLEKALQGIASSKGIRASQAASMQNNALSNQQSQLAGQAAIRDAMERDAANNTLANIFMQQEGQKMGVAQANQAQQQRNIDAQDRMLGMGATAAGYAFGGPIGGLIAGQTMEGLTDNAGQPLPTNMGKNPYNAPVASTASMQYDPSRYNMGQSFQF